MKRANLLIFFFLLHTLLFGQQNKLDITQGISEGDSLKMILVGTENDSVRLTVYNELGNYFQEFQLDSSIYYFQQMLLLSQNFNFKLRESRALRGIGYGLSVKAEYAEAFEFLNSAHQITEDAKSEDYISKREFSFYYPYTKHQIREIARANVLRNMSYLYQAVDNQENYLLYLMESKKSYQNLQYLDGLYNVNMNLARLYLVLDSLDLSMSLANESIKGFKDLGKTKYLGLSLGTIGKIHLRKNEYGLAETYISQAVESARRENNGRFLTEHQIAMAELFAKKEMPEASIDMAFLAIENAKMIGLPNDEAEAYRLISQAYAAKSEADRAYYYLQKSNVLKDSVNTAHQENIGRFYNAILEENLRNRDLAEERIKNENKNRIYLLLAGLALFLIIVLLLYRNNLHKQRTNVILEGTLANLKATQSQLIQSEKMASLGELTAGIAHEIQNPLNFVNNFSEVNSELLEELEDALRRERPPHRSGSGSNEDLIKELMDNMEQNLSKINEHGKRADGIVKGMLEHSKSSSGEKVLTDVNALADEYLKLAYHGLRGKDKNFQSDFQTNFDKNLPKVNVIPQDIGRVLLNLLNNAFWACEEQNKLGMEGFQPKVVVSTKLENQNVIISIQDNGPGIPDAIKEKIFQPFFTTKPTGQGTGLGLSLAYDIVKAHGGELKVESPIKLVSSEKSLENSEGSSFTIILISKKS